MRYNLLLTNYNTNEIVFDKWFDRYIDAVNMFMDMRQYIGVGYWLHIVDSDNELRLDFYQKEVN